MSKKEDIMKKYNISEEQYDRAKAKINYLRIYLGEYFTMLSEEEKDYFSSFDIKNRESLVVESGNPGLLGKFITFYLRLCEYDFTTYEAYEYMDLHINKELGFYDLYIIKYLKETLESGGSANFLRDLMMYTIPKRMGKGLTTLIVTEKPLSYLANSSKYRYIKLSDYLVKNKSIVDEGHLKQTSQAMCRGGINSDGT
jgi:hypothetical protein